MQPIEHKAMKTSIWKRFFRCGLNFHGGGHAARYNGHEAERDAKIASVQAEIDALERGEFNYYVPPTYINKIKEWLKM